MYAACKYTLYALNTCLHSEPCGLRKSGELSSRLSMVTTPEVHHITDLGDRSYCLVDVGGYTLDSIFPSSKWLGLACSSSIMTCCSDVRYSLPSSDMHPARTRPGNVEDLASARTQGTRLRRPITIHRRLNPSRTISRILLDSKSSSISAFFAWIEAKAQPATADSPLRNAPVATTFLAFRRGHRLASTVQVFVGKLVFTRPPLDPSFFFKMAVTAFFLSLPGPHF